LRKQAEEFEELRTSINETTSKLGAFAATNFDLGNTLNVIDKKLKIHRNVAKKDLEKLQSSIDANRHRIKVVEADLEATMLKTDFQDEQRKVILDMVQEQVIPVKDIRSEVVKTRKEQA